MGAAPATPPLSPAARYGMLYRAANGIWGHCLVECHHPAPGRVVVVATELPDNDGPSITDAAADVWTLVEARHAPDPGVALVRVECWPHPRGATHDRIEFSRSDHGVLHTPRWRRLAAVALEELLLG